MIHVQEQSFAPVEKSEAEKIVVDKCRQWPKNDGIEAEFPRHGSGHAVPHTGIAIHVFQIEIERWIGVVNQSAF